MIEYKLKYQALLLQNKELKEKVKKLKNLNEIYNRINILMLFQANPLYEAYNEQEKGYYEDGVRQMPSFSAVMRYAAIKCKKKPVMRGDAA